MIETMGELRFCIVFFCHFVFFFKKKSPRVGGGVPLPSATVKLSVLVKVV